MQITTTNNIKSVTQINYRLTVPTKQNKKY